VNSTLSGPPGVPGAPLAQIVLAEDDGPAAAVLCAVLGRAGYRVTVAPDGPSVLAHLSEHGAPDVLLLDWMLPGMSGLEVCHQVRRDFDALTLPILIVTAKADAESISAAFDAGASDYITKPFLGAELRARIAAHLRLKRTVEEREQMEERLREREKLSALGLLVSGVAHDLNNPLAGISGYAQLLLRSESDESKSQDLRHILQEVERCRRIVGNLLSFGRRHPPERAAVDLVPVLRATFEMRERHIRAAGVRPRLRIAPGLPRVVADSHQLQQVFLNIVINAEQALREQGTTLSIGASSATNGVAGEWLVIDFFNDGPPIPPEALPQIFDPFFTTKSAEEGTGLGLAICQRIVREHGGELDVESGERGTTFRVRLPVAAGMVTG
jgi:signal transduction histidine kinase